MLYGPLRSLKYLRVQRLLSQIDLAEASGVSRSTIMHAEDGDHVFGKTVRRLARTLDVSIEELCAKPPRDQPTTFIPHEAAEEVAA